MGYNILCYSFSQKSDADSVTNDCRAAFGLPAQTAARPDGKYQVEVTGISAESRAYAISAVMSQAKYNTVSGSTLLSYTYSTQNDANLWKNNLQTACGMTATVSAKSGGYQISLSSSNAAAIGRLLGKALYNEVKKEESSCMLNVPSLCQYSFNETHGSTFGRSACFATCYLVVAQFYGHNISMNNLIKNGDVDPTNARVNNFSLIKCTEGSKGTIDLTKIKSELDAGRPPIIELKDHTTGNQHFFVVKGYVNNGISTNDFIVMDPGYEENKGQIVRLDVALTRQKPYYQTRYTSKR